MNDMPSLKGRRVALIILNMAYGGAERLVQELALDLSRAGARPVVVCLDAVAGNTEPLDAANIPIILIKRRQMALDFGVVRRLSALLEARDVEVVHAHDLTSLAHAVLAGWRLRRPVLFTEHSRHYIDARWRRRLEKRLLCLGVRRLAAVSPELAQATVTRDGVPGDKVLVIENGVDLDAFAAPSDQALRRELGVAPSGLLVGMVGRLEEIKGPHILLEAFAALAAAVPEATLVFVGDGGLRAGLENRTKALGLDGRVSFTGARADIPQVMAGLDILALPSLSEGLPFALLEGMAAAKPVVATAVGRIPAIVRDGENGLLTPPGDAAGLAGRMRRLLGDGTLRARLGDQARACMAAGYDRRTMLAGYRQLYAEALGASLAAHGRAKPCRPPR